MKTRALLVGTLALGACLAAAEPFTAGGSVPGRFQILDLTLFGNALTAQVGPQTGTYGSSTITGFCVDATRVQQSGASFDVNVGDAASSLNNGARIAGLVNRYGTGALTEESGAGLQLAIWDVLYDGGDGLGTGDFRAGGVSSGTQGFFSTFLGDSLSGVSTVATFYDPTTHGDAGNLNQGLVAPVAPVPEPASLAALAVGGLAFLRRRRNA